MAWFNWSQTASDNAGADPTVDWHEGQAPSSINDSARAMMAATAKWRDDISGATVTAGSSTAYTLSSFSNFDTLAHMSGQMVAFSPHATNGAGPVLLNVDGLGQKPLRSAPNAELLAGTIIQGTPYVAVYNNSDGAFYLQGFFGNPYNIPLGAGMDYWLPTAPNSSFVFPVGQAISRTTYATLFAAMGTTYGVGDGSTTFNLPDKVGRASVMRDPVGIRITGTYFSSTDLGGSGGTQAATLGTSNLPPYTPSGATVAATGSVNYLTQAIFPSSGSNPGATQVGTGSFNNTGNISIPSLTVNGSPQGGTSTPFGIVQPSAICNYILRVI